MILISILIIFSILILYVFLYLFFRKRTDRFMESWEKELREKIERVTSEGLQPLEEAAEAIKASRMAMEEFAIGKGYITKPNSQESSVGKTIIETQAEPMASPIPSYHFATYESRKREEWENWGLPAKPAPCTS